MLSPDMNLPPVEYIGERAFEEPFIMHGYRFLFCNVRVKGVLDIGVYCYDTDMAYDYQSWREAFNLK
jgi:hypothetical protein